MLPGVTVGDVVLGCVADNTPKYLSQALRLVQSVRWFGGPMADAAFIVGIVDAVDAAFRDAFERHGATVRIVRRFHRANPFPNKLRLLELPELDAFGTTVLLDCDTIVVRDVLPLLTPGVLQARMAGYPTVSTRTFRRLFAHFKMAMPSEDHRCSVSGAPTIWYCNDGVVVLPADLRKDFVPAWTSFASALCDDGTLLRAVQNFCTQASLTLAYFSRRVPFSALPLEANCPSRGEQDAGDGAVTTCDPAIIHYHHRVDGEGFLLATPNRRASDRIAAFNERLRQEVDGTRR
jgi:hypothetical protein